MHIRHLIDTVHQHKCALEKLNLSVQHWDALLVPIILSKLDDRTNREWEIKQSSNELPSLESLIEFLTKKCFALEAVNQDFHKFSGHNRVKPDNKNHSIFQQKHTFVVTSKSPENSEEKPHFQCFICKENHLIYHCPKYNSVSVPEKYNEIKKI